MLKLMFITLVLSLSVGCATIHPGTIQSNCETDSRCDK